MHGNLLGTEIGEDDGGEASVHGRWSLVLETKQRWPH